MAGISFDDLVPGQQSAAALNFDDLIPQAKPPVSTGEDVAKSVAGSGIPRGVAGMAMWLPNLLNQAADGPQLLYRGLTGREHDNSPTWHPFYGSEDLLKDLAYQPQTAAGKAADFATQLGAGLATAKVASGAPLRPRPAANQLAEQTNLDVLASAKPKAPASALDAGLRANQQISRAYEAASKKASDLYGQAYSLGEGKLTGDQGIKKLVDDAVESLANRPALEPSEQRVLSRLSKVQQNLDRPVQQTILNAQGEPMQGAISGSIGLNDLVDIDQALGSTAKSNAFADSGGHAMGQLQSKVRTAIDNLADEGHGDFAKAVNTARTNYRDTVARPFLDNPEIDAIWQPEDYQWFKNGGTMPAGTISRANNLLGNLDTNRLGRVSTLTSVLPGADSSQILGQAMGQARKEMPSLAGALLKAPFQAATMQPKKAIGTLLDAVNNESPLLDLASQLRGNEMAKRIAPLALGQANGSMLRQEGETPQPAPSPSTNMPSPAPAAMPDFDPLFRRVIRQESGGNQSSISPKGAIGVAQIMPGTAPDAAKAAGLPYDPIKLRTDANYNAALGQAYLGKMRQKYGNDALALIAYNWGPGNTDMWLKSGGDVSKLPRETRNYVTTILGGS